MIALLVILFIITLEGVESNPGPSRFSFSSDYSDSVGSNNSAGLVRNFAMKKINTSISSPRLSQIQRISRNTMYKQCLLLDCIFLY